MRIGVDIGGTKIEVVALTGQTVAWRKRTPTPKGPYEAVLAQVRALVAEAEAALGARGQVGVGAPGSLAQGVMRNANLASVNGRALDRDLAKALGRPVRLANDANCFVLAEAAFGAAAGAALAFGVTLGTGVGGGLVADGRLWAGPNGLAGEWGHLPLPWPTAEEAAEARPCYCGKTGCLEQFLSGGAFEREFAARTGRALTALEIIAGEDADCARARGVYIDRLGRALALLIDLIDPEVIVLGGGLSNFPQLYETVPAAWAPWVFGGRAATPLRRASAGAASGALGAACLWP